MRMCEMPIIVLKLGKGSGVIGDPTQGVGRPSPSAWGCDSGCQGRIAKCLPLVCPAGMWLGPVPPRTKICIVCACMHACVYMCVFASVYGLLHTFRCPAPHPSPPVDSVVTSLWLLVSVGAAGPGCVPMWSAWRRLLPTCS